MNQNKLKNNEPVTHVVDPENNNDLRITIIFITPAQQKVLVITPINKKLEEVLIEYVSKVGVGPNLIGNGLYFLFNGQKLKKEDYNKTLSQIGLINMSNIIVIDPNFVIGAQ